MFLLFFSFLLFSRCTLALIGLGTAFSVVMYVSNPPSGRIIFHTSYKTGEQNTIVREWVHGKRSRSVIKKIYKSVLKPLTCNWKWWTYVYVWISIAAIALRWWLGGWEHHTNRKSETMMMVLSDSCSRIIIALLPDAELYTYRYV